MKNLLLSLAFLMLLISSCDDGDDLQINSDWENIPVVIGLIDPSDTAHYIRINKGFIGDGDIYEMAMVGDSLQYKNELKVSLIEYVLISGTESQPFNPSSWQKTNRDTIRLYRTQEFSKDSLDSYGRIGTFSRDKHYLYKTTEGLYPERKYRLEIKIPGEPKLISSEAYTIGDIVITTHFHPTDPAISLANEVTPMKIKWKSSVYGRLFQPILIFHYTEIENDISTDKKVTIYYDKKSSERVRIPADYDGTEMSQIIGGVQFFKSLSELIPEKQNVKRLFKTIDIGFLSGGNELYNYLNTSETTIGYGQEAAEFTNISNGVGVFDARAQYYKKDIRFNKQSGSLDSLANGRYTKHLNFSRFTAK